jgi:nitric oxide reductase large subunit
VYPTIWELSLAGAEGSIANGYWHARRLTFLMGGTYHKLEWLRMVGDVVFLFAGALPITLGALRSVWKRDLSPTA